MTAPLSAQSNNAEEIEVYLDFRHRGVINSVIISYYKNDEFYLPVSELFSLFNIDHTVNGLIIDGRFGIEQIPYRINFQSGEIRFGDERIEITAEDYILREIDSYLRADLFYEAFGLDFTIDFNNLSLNLETQRELPAIQQAIRRQRRQIADQNRLEQEQYPLRYDRERPFLDGGFVDYNLSANVNSNRNVYNFNTNLGLQVYGGDLQGAIFGSYSENFTNFATDNLRWRYMYRDQPWLSKLTIGQTTTDGFARNAYTGIRLTNEPIEPRRLFDEFEVQGTTIPQSEVELYLNNALIDFQQADELGNYRFLTPVSYGSSQLDLKIYGPTGQIIERSERLQVPFTFQPSGVFNYTVNAGRLDNPIFGQITQDFTAQGTGAYGISEWLTAKAGVEYYEGYHESLPTFTASLSSRIKSNYILTLEAASEAYYRGLLNVIYPNSASFTLDYTSYNEGFSIYNPSNDEQRLVASAFYPFNFWGVPFNIRTSIFSRYRASTSSSNFRLDLNSRIRKLNLRVGYSDRFSGSFDPFNPTNTAFLETSATYNVSRNRNLPAYLRGVFLRGQFRYQPSLNQMESAEVLLSQNVFEQGRLQLSYGRNFAGEYNSLRFNLVVDFDKVRTSTTYSNIRGSGNLTQNVRGSMGYDTNYDNFIFTSRDQVGRSGTAVKLFVDNNADGIFGDEDDPIAGNALRIQRSGATSTVKNGVIYYTQMQPYYFYNMELNKSLIQNPMLVPEFEKFGLITDPNRFKKVEVPFYMSGVVEGRVQRILESGNTTGVAGLKLMMTDQDGSYSKELRTFSDGSFYDYEVPPGNYTLQVDSAQLEILGVYSEPEQINFEVERSTDGDFVEGLAFELIPSGKTREDLQQIADATETTTQAEIDTTETIEEPVSIIMPDTLGMIVVNDGRISGVVTDSVTQEGQDSEVQEQAGDQNGTQQKAAEQDGVDLDTDLPPVIAPPGLPVTGVADTDTDSAQTDSLQETVVSDPITDLTDDAIQITDSTTTDIDELTDMPADSSIAAIEEGAEYEVIDSVPKEDSLVVEPHAAIKEGIQPPIVTNPELADGDSVLTLPVDSTITEGQPDTEQFADSTDPGQNMTGGEGVTAAQPPVQQTGRPDSVQTFTGDPDTAVQPVIDAIPAAFRSTDNIESLTPGRCIYGIQFASYSKENQAEDLSRKLEDDHLTFTIYNTPYQLYGLREIQYQSLGRVTSATKELNTSYDFEAAVISQCYANLDLNPETTTYYIQIAEFATEENAKRYLRDLKDVSGITATEIPGDRFGVKVGIGPFRSERQAAERLRDLKGDLENYSNASIRRYAPPVKVTDLSFEFLLLLDEFTTQEQAFGYGDRVENTLSLNTKVLIDENKETYVVTTELMEGWTLINDLKERVISSGASEDPVILMIEKKN
ncbi:SPOR domain-containing protein [Gracilimonas sp. Q87]|uniref:SPOR domain-containing protein n=1 Tax=Gracilimonas sp. Q87 TaxID=3384766 RepID=UPI003983F77C